MLFNSFDFAVFLPIVFIFYWIISRKNNNAQNIILVIASYIFYGWWDWRFLLLIFFSTVADFLIGKKIASSNEKSSKKLLLWLSLFLNIGLLGYFKYYNFFVESFVNTFSLFGFSFHSNTINIILPVGISFYTFQTLSYTIDVYKGRLKPVQDLISFTAFVSFFPQLVAGPIERATNLLPQFYQARRFNYNSAINGCRQILWGFFKKVVIADNCAEYANLIFNNSEQFPGSVLFIGAVLFSFQIYGDFSGYSDIAIGVSRFFGINLSQNFAFPYFSRNIGEFWRRWHISLSTWFRDYLYIPLGGSKGSTLKKIRNTFIIFIVSGFWHGANWTFIVWGALNAFYFLPLLLTGKNRKFIDFKKTSNKIPFKEMLMIVRTFLLTALAWVFFRADSVEHALTIIEEIFSSSFFVIPNGGYFAGLSFHPFIVISLIGFFLFVEWMGKTSQYAIEELGLSWNRNYRNIFYYLILFSIFWFGGKEQQFIYFQF